MIKARQRFALVRVIGTHDHQEEALENMRECEQLVTTFGGEVINKSVQHRESPHPNTYIGKGKVEWLKQIVKAEDVDVVVVDAMVKPSQLFRVERALWEVNSKIQVWDRMDLILNIFDKHASSKEAKLQIELARIAHTGPRIYGLGRTVLSRQGGGIGQRGGFGETNIEFERRLMKERRLKVQKQLRKVAGQKQDRLRFRQEQGYGPVALVGYTSAGKTTLFNVLTGKNKETHKRLFTTLDTVVGKLKTPENRLPLLISDTIGFIRDLPPELIDAFRSTLMESLEAKLVLHIVDVTDSEISLKIETVEKILCDLKVIQPVILVFNKTDQLKNGQREKLAVEFANKPHLFTSAKTGTGIETLKETLITNLVKEDEYDCDIF